MEVDERTTRLAKRQLRAADVIMVLLGTTTEVWRDAELGRPTNQIPPPEAYHAGGWTLDDGDLQGIREDLSAIKRLLAEHIKAVPVYSVCPIPLHATWLDRNVVDANGRGKALLRTALELEGTSPASTYRSGIGCRPKRNVAAQPSATVVISIAVESTESCCSPSNTSPRGRSAPIGIRERLLAPAQDLRERIQTPFRRRH